MDEAIAEKIITYKCIFKKKYGTYNESRILELLKAIEERDYIFLYEVLQPHNKASREIFRLETGIKLDNTLKATQEALRQYCEESYLAYKKEQAEKIRLKEEAKHEKENSLNIQLNGFKKEESKLVRSLALKYLLSKYVEVNGAELVILKEYIENEVNNRNCFLKCGVIDGKAYYKLNRWETCEVEDANRYHFSEDCVRIDNRHIMITRGIHVAKTGYEYAKYLMEKDNVRMIDPEWEYADYRWYAIRRSNGNQYHKLEHWKNKECIETLLSDCDAESIENWVRENEEKLNKNKDRVVIRFFKEEAKQA